MRDPLRRISIRYKLAFAFLGVCLLAFGVGGYLVSRSARGALEEEIHARLDFQCRSYSEALDGQLQLLGRRTEDFCSDGYIRAGLEALQQEGAPEELQRRRTELQRHLRENKLPLIPAFLNLALLDVEGRVVVAALDPAPTVGVDLRGSVSGIRETWFSDFLTLGSPARPVFLTASPVYDLRGGRIIGRMLAWVNPGVWIGNALRPLSVGHAPRAEDVRILLADRGGVRLPVPESYLESGGPRPESEVADSGFGLQLSGSGAPGAASLQVADLRWFARALEIPANGWSVVLAADDALAAVAGLQSRFLGYGLLLAALAAAFLFFPMRFLARPLNDMRTAALRMQQGEFDTRVPVDSEDELGELARSFNHMAAAVEERTRRLEATAADLRDRRNELKKERDRLDAVIASMRDGLMVLDGQGSLVFSNQGARPLAELVLRGDARITSHHTCREAEGGDPDCASCLFDPRAPARSCVVDLGQSVYEIHSAFLPVEPDGSRGRVLVSRDITDRVAQDETQIHQERLAVMGEVAAVMAHELNNPLAAISMFNQMLASELPAGSSLLENVEVIGRNTEACKRTIRELLDYATGAMPEIGPIDLHETLHDVARFLRPVGERSRVQWEWRLDSAEALVSGDEIQLRQVFVNLIMNAIQAMEEEGGKLKVSSLVSQDHVAVEIADTGPGIAPEAQEQVFRAFYTTKPRGAGTGLGLPTSRRIAEMHGGGLELVRSEPGCTVFRVRVRRRLEELSSEVRAESGGRQG